MAPRLTERGHLALALLIVLLFVAACALIDGGVGGAREESGEVPAATSSNQDGSGSSADPGSAPAEQREPTADPAIRKVPAEQWQAMVAAGMVRPGCPVTKPAQLRRLDIGYVDFAGELQRGHLVVRRDIAASVARIFTALFDERFPIASMQGVENYRGDSNASLADNNTSAYNCRRLDQINAPVGESPHANGRAVDINPLQNPWKDLRCQCWSPSKRYSARTPGPGKIVDGDFVVQLFEDEGWIWQNIDVPDYMHFDTGYPSSSYRRPTAGG
jgi:hypothetical protein